MATAQDYIAYLVNQHKLSPLAARAAVARFQQESGQGLSSTIVGDRTLPGGSVGLGQWNRERKTGLLNFAGDRWSDPYRQLDYFVYEGQGPEARAYNRLTAAKTPEEAAQAMMDYERPKGWVAGNPTAGHGYANTLRNYYALAGQPLPAGQQPVMDGPKGQEQIVPAGYSTRPQGPVEAAGGGRGSDPAIFVPSTSPGGPVEAAGGGAGSEAGAGAAAPAAAPAATPWWQTLAQNIGKVGQSMGGGGGGGGPSRGGAPQPQAARIDQGDVPTIDPQQQEQQRQMLALAMQRLNSGRLF